MSRWPLRDVTRAKIADRALGDKVHKATLHTVHGRARLVADMPQWAELRERAHEARRRGLDHHDELLAAFVARLEGRGVHVLRAATAADAAKQISALVMETGGRVIKSKSMTSEEVGLNGVLAAAGAEVTETDLGELIVQLADEPPSHITAPALHLSTEDIAHIFGEHLGFPVPDWVRRGDRVADEQRHALAQELSLAARAHLRERFLRADVGISGANFLVSETGTIVLVENEGNIQLTTSLPKRHIVLAGIDKLIDDEADLAVLLQLLPVSATGQRQSCYVSLFADSHPDMHVVLLDNGRSELLQDPELRDVLMCMRCGACMNDCPVYRNVGGHAYGGAYPGPIGTLLMPNLESAERYGDLPFACSICGACTDACPVGIPVHDTILQLRARLAGQGYGGGSNLMAQLAASVLGSDRRLELAAALYPAGRLLAPLSPAGRAWTATRDLPVPPKETFHSWWARERGDGRPAVSARSPARAAIAASASPSASDAAAAAARAVSITEVAPAAGDLLARFVQRFQQLGPAGECEIHWFERAAEAEAFLRQRVADHPPQAVLIDGERSAKRDYGLGISAAALLVADTGGVVLDLARRIRGRAATLVETHIVVARPDQVVGGVADALATRSERRAAGQWHDVQVLVTGPSRTADVEKVLVIPAHGPRRLELVLCPEPVELKALRSAEPPP
ncbi:MAG: LUD domain-containing protein [Deltaproteobacteria bacterium]|nr:LUD domain-containing protein [Deltaproteobacteria bacterium]